MAITATELRNDIKNAMLGDGAGRRFNGHMDAAWLTIASGFVKFFADNDFGGVATRTLVIGPAAFCPVSNAASFALSAGQFAQSPPTAFADVSLPVGKTIAAIRAFVRDSASGPTKLRVDFSSTDSSGNNTVIASSSISAGTGAAQTLSIVGLSTTIASTRHYTVTVATSTGTGACAIYGLEVDYS